MDRIYGKTLHPLKMMGSREGDLFTKTGQVGVIVATFRDAASMLQHGTVIEEWWRQMGQNSNFEAQINNCVASQQTLSDPKSAGNLKALAHLNMALDNIKDRSQGIRFTSTRTLNTILLVARVRGDGHMPPSVRGHRRTKTTLGGNK